MGPVLEVSIGLRYGVGFRLHVGAAMVRDVRMTVGPILGVSLGMTEGVGCNLGEGTLDGIGVVVEKINPTVWKKERGGRSNTGLWHLCGSSFSGRGCAAFMGRRLGGMQE